MIISWFKQLFCDHVFSELFEQEGLPGNPELIYTGLDICAKCRKTREHHCTLEEWVSHNNITPI